VSESTNDHDKADFAGSEEPLGGADAVEKTTYVVGKGTDPNALSPVGRPAKVGRRGMGMVVWVAAAVLVLLVVVYVFGVMPH
jgi:hypothetical protein